MWTHLYGLLDSFEHRAVDVSSTLVTSCSIWLITLDGDVPPEVAENFNVIACTLNKECGQIQLATTQNKSRIQYLHERKTLLQKLPLTFTWSLLYISALDSNYTPPLDSSWNSGGTETRASIPIASRQAPFPHLECWVGCPATLARTCIVYHTSIAYSSFLTVHFK